MQQQINTIFLKPNIAVESWLSCFCSVVWTLILIYVFLFPLGFVFHLFSSYYLSCLGFCCLVPLFICCHDYPLISLTWFLLSLLIFLCMYLMPCLFSAICWFSLHFGVLFVVVVVVVLPCCNYAPVSFFLLIKLNCYKQILSSPCLNPLWHWGLCKAFYLTFLF